MSRYGLAGGKLAPTTAFDEVSKLLFCKLRDENINLMAKHTIFQIGTNETADEVYKRINAIYQTAKKEDEEVFRKTSVWSPMFTVVEHLQELAISRLTLIQKANCFLSVLCRIFPGQKWDSFSPSYR